MTAKLIPSSKFGIRDIAQIILVVSRVLYYADAFLNLDIKLF